MSPFDSALLLLAGFAVAAVSIGVVVWVVRGIDRTRVTQHGDAARDLAMQSVLAIDDFVGACYIVAHDFPEYDVDEPENFFLHADDPVLLLPKDADWSLLDRELSDEIRWLPNRLRNVRDALESIDIEPPQFNDLFEHRQDDYARLGLRGMDLVERICTTYQLPLPTRPDYYNPRKGFVSKIREMDEFWRRRVQSAGQVRDEPSNVTPLFGRTAAPETALT
ncbi:hypothetical protein ASE04_18930 [Rhizobium sp. Root708]|uniref:hypothetical protein n=1 Tax=Rhizobium sp. Root708 TaxID=1736592 RepID=UPI0006F2AE36|nr:hypothetical protein [Rhizobium sp. Root708]KRB49243.1 hypothetical protein ASE04_18930 [Rhizobium sp. Root708]